MSGSHDPWPASSSPPPSGQPPFRPEPPPRRRSPWGCLLLFLFMISLGFNLILLLAVGALSLAREGSNEEGPLRESYHSGQRSAQDKVAVVHIEGVIMEGMMNYARRQITQASKDPHVKAVVIRINSPGGTITASDDLHKRLLELRDGDPALKTAAKPLVVSMGSVAASGGYYIAAPAQHLVAERTTITGSIGVYASFPNVHDLAKDYGVKMITIKAGEVKDSGSMFHPMTAQERQLWQNMVNHAFDQFQAVVQEGRGKKLKYGLRDEIKEEARQIPDRDEDGDIIKENGKEKMVSYVRRLADGGIYTADKAKAYGLIDQVGYLDDAIAEARKLGGLGADAKVVTYDKPISLLSLLGAEAAEGKSQLNLRKLAGAVGPHVWYLTPQSELSGLLTAGSGD